MKNFNNISLGSLLFIGPAIGTLLFYLFMDWRYKSTTNEVTDKQIVQYMQNSQTYPVYFDSFNIQEEIYDKAYYKNLCWNRQFIFYNKAIHKYCSYPTIDSRTFRFRILEEGFNTLKGIPFTGKININEMNSGKGDSVDDPILVWDISVDSLYLTQDNWTKYIFEKLNRRRKQREKKELVLLYYFKHFVSKEEFEKTFPKKE